MANYIATARSNYFRVKNREAFLEWVETLPDVEVVTKTTTVGISADTYYALLSDDPDNGCFPAWRFPEDGSDEIEIDLAQELSEHLVEDSIAILMEAGAEKQRYICGYAIAVNSAGEKVEIFLGDIYLLAAERFGEGPEITAAEY